MCWPDGASWAYWHIEYCQSWVEEQSLHPSFREWDADAWAQWGCRSVTAGFKRSGWALDKIEICPLQVLFTQDSISSTFSGGAYRNRLVDASIAAFIEQGRIDYWDSIEIEGFELNGRIYSINNRRLFMARVLACKGILDTIAIKLHRRDDAFLQRRKFDTHRLNAAAPKWVRHLSSRTGGLVVRVSAPGSKYEDCQAVPPCRYIHFYKETYV